MLAGARHLNKSGNSATFSLCHMSRQKTGGSKLRHRPDGPLRKEHRALAGAFVTQDDVDQVQRPKTRQQAEKRDIGVAKQ